MMSQMGHDWRVVLLAIVSGASGLLAVTAGALAVAYDLFGPRLGYQTLPLTDALIVYILSTSLAFISALLLLSTWHAVRVWRGHPDQTIVVAPIRIWAILVLVLVWVGSSLLAQGLLDHERWQWSAPMLHVAAIGVPVYLLVRLAVGGIRGGSRLRLWGTFSTGLVLGTGAATAAEAIMLFMAASAGAVYLFMNPEQLLSIERLAVQLGSTSGVEEALTFLQPFLASPAAFLVLLLAVSAITPLIEEFAKTAAPWLIYDRLATGAQGFCCGAISGAGFAVFEGLMASADSAGSWAFVLFVRGGSSMMHILASALAGWGIGAFRQSAKVVHLIGGYAVAIVIHAAWNASVVAIGYGGFRVATGTRTTDVIGVTAVAAGASVLMALLALLPVALIILNRRLRTAQTEPDAAPITGGPRATLITGRKD